MVKPAAQPGWPIRPYLLREFRHVLLSLRDSSALAAEACRSCGGRLFWCDDSALTWKCVFCVACTSHPQSVLWREFRPTSVLRDPAPPALPGGMPQPKPCSRCGCLRFWRQPREPAWRCQGCWPPTKKAGESYCLFEALP